MEDKNGGKMTVQMKTGIKFVVAGAAAALFLLLIVLLKTVDVAKIGPAGTSVGFSGLNGAVHEALGVHEIFYKITEYIGYAALSLAAVFAVLGVLQAIKRKSLWKVDREIWALGILYVAVIALYILFEIAVVNFRPVLMDGKTAAEASFPSSHTMLVGVIVGSAVTVLPKYIRTRALCVCLQAAGCAVILFTVCGRLISGVHWFTDILGGVLITAALLAAFAGTLDLLSARERRS